MRATRFRPTRVVVGLAAAITLVAASGGCTLLRSTPTPMVSVTYAPGQSDSGVYALLLPGRGDRPEDYQRARFPHTLIEAGFRGEIVAADAHLQYYLKRTAITRLRDDVVVPRAGRKPWIVGISMGGLGALLYEKEHPGEAAGLVLLAPFLGDDAVIAEIEAAGGLGAWNPGAIASGDYQRELWSWIKYGGLERVPVFLAWGSNDKFAEGNAVLAQAVPAQHVAIVPGGHTWPTWKPAFKALVNAGACGLETATMRAQQPSRQ